jgi:hypothetical protein
MEQRLALQTHARRDARVQVDETAWITIYGEIDKRVPGRVRNISGRGIGLEVGERVGTGSALKIEVGDVMMLGEVIYCRPEGERYYLGVELDQAVHSLMALGNSLRSFASDDLGSERPYAMHEADGQH